MLDSNFHSIRKSELHSRAQKGAVLSIVLYMSTTLFEVFFFDGVTKDGVSSLITASISCTVLAILGWMTTFKSLRNHIDIIMILAAATLATQHSLYFVDGFEDANYHFVFSQILATFALILLCNSIYASLVIIFIMMALPLSLTPFITGSTEHITSPVSLYFLGMGECVAVFYAILISADGRSRDEAQFKLEEQARENFDLANRDSLADCYNRRYFDAYSNQEFSKSKLGNHSLALITIDIDNFKNVNDTYGHPVGDYAIKEVVDCCASIVRSSDTISRTGGEEFIILLPETPAKAASDIADQIRQRVESCEIEVSKGDSVQFSISLGVASLDKADDSINSLLHRADQALYLSKERGKNQVTVA